MKKKVIILIGFFVIFGLLYHNSCKESGGINGVVQYSLTVSISTGVDGSPTNGTFTYPENNVVNYNYSLQSGYANLQVNLDGANVNTSGSITMNSDHILNVTADSVSTYTLTVTVDTGVNGTPSSGNYTHSENEVVNYNYSLQGGYTNLEVKIDGTNVNTSGSITMNSDHTLDATADVSSAATYDVRGDWQGFQVDSTSDQDPFFVTFTGGDASSGTTSGYVENPTPAGTGTYTVTGINIEFTLVYGFGDFALTGTFSDENNMGGDWTWTNASNQKFYGTWTLSRI